MQAESTDYSPPALSQDVLRVVVYGGKRDDVKESFNRHLRPAEDPRVFRAFINLTVLSRLSFLFEGGVESAGGIVEIVCVFIIVAVVLSVYAVVQFVVLGIVVVVLGILSGGVAFKYVISTVLETPIEFLDLTGLDDFVREQLTRGRFVRVSVLKSHTNGGDAARQYDLGELTRKAGVATDLFRFGIAISFFVGLLFMAFELIWHYLYSAWFTTTDVLLVFGIDFLLGAVILDLGTLLRRRLARRIAAEGSASP